MSRNNTIQGTYACLWERHFDLFMAGKKQGTLNIFSALRTTSLYRERKKIKEEGEKGRKSEGDDVI